MWTLIDRLLSGRRHVAISKYRLMFPDYEQVPTSSFEDNGGEYGPGDSDDDEEYDEDDAEWEDDEDGEWEDDEGWEDDEDAYGEDSADEWQETGHEAW